MEVAATGSSGAGSGGGQRQAQKLSLTCDALVVADSLPAKAGSPGEVALSGSAQVAAAMARMAGLTRVPLFSLLMAYRAGGSGGLRLPFDAATILNSPHFQWLADGCTKPGRTSAAPAGAAPEAWSQSWTAITTPEYGQQLLGISGVGQPLPPQSKEYLEERAEQMFAQLVLALTGGTVPQTTSVPRPDVLVAHRWGSAYTTPPLGQPCLSVPAAHFVACGDFCLGPGVETAALSGLAAAEAVVSALGRKSIVR